LRVEGCEWDAEEIIRLIESAGAASKRAVGGSELSASGSFLMGEQDALAALKPFKMKVAQDDGPFDARLLIYDRSWLGDLIASVDHA
jgi:hypothetical protein